MKTYLCQAEPYDCYRSAYILRLKVFKHFEQQKSIGFFFYRELNYVPVESRDKLLSLGYIKIRFIIYCNVLFYYNNQTNLCIRQTQHVFQWYKHSYMFRLSIRYLFVVYKKVERYDYNVSAAVHSFSRLRSESCYEYSQYSYKNQA